MHESKQFWKYHKVTSYGESYYVRLVNGIVQVHCALKIQGLTIKICLNTQTRIDSRYIISYVSKMVKDELDIYVHKEAFWTNSQVVLGYINSDVHRFNVFVSTRVLQIQNQYQAMALC